ncbi:NADH oxidase [Peptococcaceae bacterium CEB3]|nr:NADH oxidase [Peptococcaceae bacterium CEB3]
MPGFEKFNFRTRDELEAKIQELKLDLPMSADFTPLSRKVAVGEREIPNALAIQPMEGCDGQEDGTPSELTFRRYRRFAAGGAGLIWLEATAVVPEGRANPRQLAIHSGNLPVFRQLADSIREEARHSMGVNHRPLLILQLTHSGRYSKPGGKAEPIIAQHDPYLDPAVGVQAEHEPITDDDLERLQERYVEAAKLAEEAGFDGVDIKSCHRYLLSELLAAHTRPGRFGGSFGNRTRFLLETVAKVKKVTGSEFILAVRLNVFDGHPYPYGWGVDKHESMRPDLSEPRELVRLLREQGVSLLNVTAGNPYFRNPEINRPLDVPLVGAPWPEEHPLQSVARLVSLAAEMQRAEPDLTVVGSGYSWLRQFAMPVGAANIARGAVSIVGLGRQSFADPGVIKEALTEGRVSTDRVCLACSRCTQIMRDGGRTGCVVRDSEVYLPIYRAGRAKERC